MLAKVAQSQVPTTQQRNRKYAAGNRAASDRQTADNAKGLLFHGKNRVVDLLAIGKRAIRKGVLGNDLRNRVFDAQIVFPRTVDRQHRQVFYAQRRGGRGIGLLFGSAGDDNTISPRGGSSITLWRICAMVPRRICSKSLVSSRQSAILRFGPNTSSRSAMASSMRCKVS